jgi:Na+-translocating ferredoxin:NAD+ oxidoreductase RnfE subunit
MTFSSRETALLIWSAAFFIWALTVSGFRRSLPGLFRAALQWKLLVPVIVVILYMTVVVWGLYLFHLWTPRLLKDTVAWLLFSGIALAFSAVNMDATAPTWRSLLTDQLKAVILVEYLLNTYTFSLWVELLLVPSVTTLVILDAFARTKQKYQSIAKLTGFFLGISGIAIFWFAFRNAVGTSNAFSISDALQDLLLPPILSLALLPLVYLFFLISAYEQLFLVLRFGPKKGPELIRYAKQRFFWQLGLRPSLIRSFLRTERTAVMTATTKAQIDELLKRWHR